LFVNRRIHSIPIERRRTSGRKTTTTTTKKMTTTKCSDLVVAFGFIHAFMWLGLHMVSFTAVAAPSITNNTKTRVAVSDSDYLHSPIGLVTISLFFESIVFTVIQLIFYCCHLIDSCIHRCVTIPLFAVIVCSSVYLSVACLGPALSIANSM